MLLSTFPPFLSPILNHVFTISLKHYQDYWYWVGVYLSLKNLYRCICRNTNNFPLVLATFYVLYYSAESMELCFLLVSEFYLRLSVDPLLCTIIWSKGLCKINPCWENWESEDLRPLFSCNNVTIFYSQLGIGL